MAFAQSDLKRFLGWTSISHMGFVMLAAFVWAMGLPQSNELVLQGAVIVILAHGIGTSAMFILVGSIFERVQSREVGRMGGLWTQMPRLSGTFLFFALASMGLPALATFVGEFLVLLGTFKVSVAAAAVAASVFVASAIYTLWIVQQTLQGPPRKGEWPSPGKPHDLTAREWVMMIVSIAIMVWMGLYPRNVLDTSAPAIRGLHQQATQTKVWPLPQQPSANPADGSSQAQGGQP
jgi:NADH-quinone oxidoreductase subunit M